MIIGLGPPNSSGLSKLSGLFGRYVMLQERKFEPSHTDLDFSKYDKPYEIRRTKILEEIMPEGHGGQAVDIGCGPGFFSKMLSGRGWHSTAIDTSRSNIESAKEYAASALLGDAITTLSDLPEDNFGLAVAFEIIEHMPRAEGEELLRKIRRVLKPDGRLLLSTPNRYSLEGLGGYYWGEKIRKAGKWYAWDTTHVHIYSSPEILALLNSIGYSVGKIVGYHYGGRLPLIGRYDFPLKTSRTFPLNRLGFNIIMECRKK